MIVLTPEEMRKMDRETIADGYPELLLMEMAGRGIAELVKEKSFVKSKKVTIFCGKGNNGGDGFTAARFFDMWDYDLEIIYTGNNADDLSEVSLTNYNICRLRDIPIKRVKDLNKSEIRSIINNSEILIDAMLGTGLKGELRGDYTWLIDMVNQYRNNKLVFSVDIPSGIDGRSGKLHGRAIKADITVTMAFYKTGLSIYPGREYCGEVEIIDLGMVSSSLEKVGYSHYLLDKKDAAEIMPLRDRKGHKGSFGKVSIVGGSKGMAGAPALTGKAALRTGAGLVKIALPELVETSVADYRDELIIESLAALDKTISQKAADQIIDLAEEMDVIAVGPGMGRSIDVEKIIEKMVLEIEKPLVVDADGINAIKDLAMLKKREDPLILTPHPGEMSELIDRPIEEIQKNRVEISRDFSSEYGVCLILKGASTIIALPNGDIYINQTGGDGLATAGSGDVLTGIIAGLLAQGVPPQKAAVLGPYLHGSSGDKAEEKLSSYSMIAGDIIDFIPLAVKDLI